MRRDKKGHTMTSRLNLPSFHALLLGLLAMLLAGHALADPPGRVGRIGWMSGSVQLRNADTGEWNTAVLNWPLTNGDALSTGPGARLEIGIGSTVVRLDSSSEIAIDQLDDERVRLYLVSGTAAVRLRSREAAQEFELATSTGRFTMRDVGAFRFDFDDNLTSATAYLGTLQFESEDSAIDIPAGQRAQFWYSGRTMYSTSNPVRDDFSDWNIARDERLDTRETRRHVSQEMTGYEDLAGYGSWYESVDYGPIWYPRVVPSGWAPYRAGHWAWVAPWGWTWIDDAPWGFAPFHYGRWVWHRDRWGWAPGKRIVRPVYAPALVAWIDTPGISVGISSGPTVGWFPLAPREVYVPSYRCSTTYVRNVNITHVTHIRDIDRIVQDPRRAIEHNRYVNRRLEHAVTIVPADVVTHRRPVAPVVERPRDPHFFDRINRQPPLVAAPVTMPPLPPRRHDAEGRDDRRDDRRDARDGSRRDPRDGDRRDARREFTPAQPRPPADDRMIGTPPAQPPAQVVRPRHATEDWPIGDPAPIPPIRKRDNLPAGATPVPPPRRDVERAPGRIVEPRPQTMQPPQPSQPQTSPPPPRNRPDNGWSAGTPPAQPPAQVNRPRHATEDWPIGDPAPIQRPANPQPRAVPTPPPRQDFERGNPRPMNESRNESRAQRPPAPPPAAAPVQRSQPAPAAQPQPAPQPLPRSNPRQESSGRSQGQDNAQQIFNQRRMGEP